MAGKLTKRQQQILRFIEQSIENNGFPPTRAEISAHFDFRSPNAAESHLRALERKGVITVLPGTSRGITVHQSAGGGGPRPAGDDVTLPLVGRVAAGSPILAAENIEDQVPVPAALFSPRADYLLTVHGMSMRDAGILDGDLLAVQRTPEARDGEIVVARLDDEVTVKRLRRRGAKAELIPANPDFAVIEVDLSRQELVIEGRAVGVIRRDV